MTAASVTRWMFGLAVAAAAMVLVLAQAAKAQTAVGDWHGLLKAPGAELRAVVKIAPGAGGALQGTILSPDQTDTPFPLADVKLDGQALSFAAPTVRGTYAGTWDSARKAWVGAWTQVGTAMDLTLEPGDLPKGAVVEGLDGVWEGALATETAKLRIVLHVRNGPYGTAATLDSPDQLAYGMPVALARAGQAVTFTQKAVGLTYEGVLDADGLSMVGHTRQGERTRDLTLTRRMAPVAAAKRPQTPHPPFPYRTEDVAFDSAPGVKLAGTLSLPPGAGPFPAAVMITGSGPQDRDETLLGHKPFAVIADDLTRRGIAVLRYDDRGVAKSMGEFGTATIQDFAVDAKAAVAFLRARPDIHPAKVGVIGHSEGGLVGPMVAAADPKLGFVVMLAGPGMPLREVLAAQRAALAPSMGLSADRAAQAQTMFDRAIDAMAAAKTQAEAEGRARAVFLAEGRALGLPAGMVDAQVKQVSSGWFRGLIAYDPRPTLSRITAPVLAVNGAKDLQVPAAQSLPAIRTALKANPDATVVELPGLNHLFQTAPTGAAGEYADIEETVAPAALKLVGDWVVAHTRR